MCCETFIQIKPQAATLAVIEQANAIIEEYASQDFRLTLRQLYYQFVARDLLEANTLEQYKRIGRIIGTGRDAGLIDWDAIELPPFSCDYEDEMLQALARSTQVPVGRVKAHYRRYIHACHVITKLLTHPGTDTKH
jgi:hypothetical protein